MQRNLQTETLTEAANRQRIICGDNREVLKEFEEKRNNLNKNNNYKIRNIICKH